uniref:ribonuclease Z n=1 Tax=Hirondellea gigas TaxID=1518452 RepID=A0A2P2I5M8_9CRUS
MFRYLPLVLFKSLLSSGYTCRFAYNGSNNFFINNKTFTNTLKTSSKNLKIKMDKISSLLMEIPKMSSKQQKRAAKPPGSRKEAVKGKHYPAPQISMQVLGSGAPGAPVALYINAGQSSYMFNCGEGTQRLSQEYKVRVSNLTNVFTTHKSWRNVGGLSGLLLTLQDAGISQILLHGPPGIHIIYKDTTEFVRYNTLDLAYHYYGTNGGVFGGSEDNVPMTVRAVPIKATTESNGSSLHENSDSLAEHMQEQALLNDTNNSSRKEGRGSKRQSPTSTEEVEAAAADGESSPLRLKRSKIDEFTTDMAVAYICTLVPWAGKLMPELCVKAGVPPGPLLAKLKAGKDVTLPDGRIVLSQDVKTPDQPGLTFLVVEAPSEGHLESLVVNQTLAALQVNDQLKAPNIIVHFTATSVMQDPRYQEWMSKFPCTTTHLAINDGNSCMGSVEVHRMQMKLRYLEPTLFPELADTSVPYASTTNASMINGGKEINADGSEASALKKDILTDIKQINTDSSGKLMINKDTATGVNEINSGSSETSGLKNDSSNLKIESRHSSADDKARDSDINNEVSNQSNTNMVDCIKGVTLMTYHLRPNTRMDRSNCPIIDRAVIMKEIAETECLQKQPDALSCDPEQQQFPVITFLGTGCSQPSKSRNMSGILVQVREESYMLLDCGEGTYGQMVRLFGHSVTADILTKLTGVYVSHKHPDHHMGLIGILLNRRRALHGKGLEVTPLPLLAPGKISSYLTSFHRHFEPLADNYKFLSNEHFLENSRSFPAQEKAALCQRLGIADIMTCYVVHCYQAFGLSITTETGKTLVYSGDTRPCERLIQLGMNCDILIHEATLADDMNDLALKKKHSTTNDALEIANAMRAKHVILTHFSQRYSKVPMPLNKTDEEVANVLIAYDNFTVSPSDLSRGAALKPSLLKMFAEYVVEMKEKATKRQLDKDREENIRADLMRANIR